MKFTIISPQQKITHTIEYLEAQTPSGSLIVQLGHAPLLVTLLASTELSFLLESGEKQTLYLTRSGFLDISRKEVTALLDQDIK